MGLESGAAIVRPDWKIFVESAWLNETLMYNAPIMKTEKKVRVSKYDKNLELKDLVGQHVLTGVDLDHQEVRDTWGEGFSLAEVIRFALDGKTYVAAEDPEDGYRSCMRWIRLSQQVCKETFKPVKVLGKMKEDSSSTVLQLLNLKTGKIVLEVGTDNQDDYYPWFVKEFNRENLVWFRVSFTFFDFGIASAI